MARLIFVAACAVLLFVTIPPLLQDWMARNGYVGVETADDHHAMTTSEERTHPASGRSGRVTLKPNAHGHYFTQAYLNNKPIRVLIDTGATLVALRHEDARKLGIRPKKSDYKVRVKTANGIAYAAAITLRSVRIGRLEERNIKALISPPGAQSVSLMGMAFLGKLKRFEIRQGTLRLEN